MNELELIKLVDEFSNIGTRMNIEIQNDIEKYVSLKNKEIEITFRKYKEEYILLWIFFPKITYDIIIMHLSSYDKFMREHPDEEYDFNLEFKNRIDGNHIITDYEIYSVHGEKKMDKIRSCNMITEMHLMLSLLRCHITEPKLNKAVDADNCISGTSFGAYIRNNSIYMHQSYLVSFYKKVLKEGIYKI